MIRTFLNHLAGKKHSRLAGEKRGVVLSLRLNWLPTQVTVAGSFNRWSCFSHPLKLSASGAWETTIALEPGSYRYRFLADNSRWILDPLADSAFNDFGGTDSVLTVTHLTQEAQRETKFAGQYA